MEVPIPLRSSLVQASRLSCRVAILLAVAIGVDAQPGMQKPAVVAQQFYIWYVGALLGDRDPIAQDRGTLEKYVAATMLAAITRRMASPDGLDSDPFIQAQDYVDDWKTVTAVERTTNGARASVLVTLGAKEPYKLRVDLSKDAGVWKIVKVARAQR